MAPSEFAKLPHTHVCTTGTVILKSTEADGDTHLRISDGQAFIVAEIIPTLQPFKPFVIPKVGSRATVCGIRRYDDAPDHGTWEVHPVECIAPGVVASCHP